jgi:hypothetical protein
MQIVTLVIVGIVVLAIVGGIAFWAHDKRESARRMAAYERVLREYPKYIETLKDHEILARKFMRELNEETITFTYKLNG